MVFSAASDGGVVASSTNPPTAASSVLRAGRLREGRRGRARDVALLDLRARAARRKPAPSISTANTSPYCLRRNFAVALRVLATTFSPAAIGPSFTAGLLLGSKDVGARAIDRLVREADGSDSGRRAVRRLWQRLVPAFATTIDYLAQHFGVHDLSHVPSETMVAVLAAFFFANKGRRPSRSEKRVLHHWFWATAIGARYTGRGFRQNLVRDVAMMTKLAETGTARFSAEVIPVDELSRTDYARPGSLTNAFFCMLRLVGPRYLEDGEPIPIAKYVARGNRSDRHHIFPRSFLRQRGVPGRRINSLLNVCFLVARENQSVGRAAPANYLDDVPKDGRARSRAMKSHLIPRASDWLIEQSVKRAFAMFAAHRTTLIVREFERLAGARMFSRS